MLSQYTRPGVAISFAQQEAMYREYLQAQLQQFLSDQGLKQVRSPSDNVVVNPVSQVTVNIQNVALPPLQPPRQRPRSPTPVMPSLNSNTFYIICQQTHRQNKSWISLLYT